MRQWLTPSTTLLSYSLSLLLLSVSISAPYLFLHLFFSILTPSHRLSLTLLNPSPFFLFLSVYPRTFPSFSFLIGFLFMYILLCSSSPFPLLLCKVPSSLLQAQATRHSSFSFFLFLLRFVMFCDGKSEISRHPPIKTPASSQTTRVQLVFTGLFAISLSIPQSKSFVLIRNFDRTTSQPY